MAFGRSNSLSLNTGATNNLFAQQQNATAQPAQSSSLFGSAVSKPGGLFGSTTTPAQPQQGGSLFGGGSAAGGSLFGASSAQSQPQQQQQQSGGLFGGSLGQSQPQAQGSGSLFGGQQNTAQTQPTATTSAFGGFGQSQAQQQKPAGSLFGGFGQQQNGQQMANKGGLFGSLGGSSNTQTPSLFGASTTQQQQQPSLLGASLFNNQNASGPMAGSLTMGQSTNTTQSVPGVKIDLSNIRPTTRFSDLHEDLRKEIEAIEGFIRQQESYASQCEALIPSHADSVASLGPDVAVIQGKAETVELGLENDGRDIAIAKDLLKGDVKDMFRCVRVIENQALPARFHYGPSLGSTGTGRSAAGGLDEEYDVDLPGYFGRQIDAMAETKTIFDGNLAEIEAHLGVVERRTAQLVGDLQRERQTGKAEGADTVRELADTLRGFEAGILDAARKVGHVRETVTGLTVDGRY